MIFSSLPDYRRFSDAALERLREGRSTSDRLAGMLFNLAILAGLWGAPLYARWVVLSDMQETKGLPEAILGKWRKSDRSFLEFTPDAQVRLIQDEALVESAAYRIVGDVIEVSGFMSQPGDVNLEVAPQCYRISIRGGQLTFTSSPTGFTPIPWHTAWERSSLRKVLPQFHGATVQFRRVDSH